MNAEYRWITCIKRQEYGYQVKVGCGRHTVAFLLIVDNLLQVKGTSYSRITTTYSTLSLFTSYSFFHMTRWSLKFGIDLHLPAPFYRLAVFVLLSTHLWRLSKQEANPAFTMVAMFDKIRASRIFQTLMRVLQFLSAIMWVHTLHRTHPSSLPCTACLRNGFHWLIADVLTAPSVSSPDVSTPSTGSGNARVIQPAPLKESSQPPLFTPSFPLSSNAACVTSTPHHSCAGSWLLST